MSRRRKNGENSENESGLGPAGALAADVDSHSPFRRNRLPVRDLTPLPENWLTSEPKSVNSHLS
jgi:hypothetical protein